MKKLFLGILCLALCGSIALSSCSGKKTDADTTDTTDGDDTTDISSIPLPDDEEEEAPLFEYSYSGGEATLTAYHGDLEEVVLEETVIRMRKRKETKTVTEEVTAADGTVSTVEKEVEEDVVVPEEYTLTAIDAGVFMNNESIKKIVIPDSVLSVGEACFQGCAALEEIVLPAELESIGPRMFYDCDSLTTLNVPDTVESIGLFAFGDYFKRIPWYQNLSDASTIVGDGILLRYNGTAGTVRYGDEVKSVAYYAFTDTAAETVYFTNALESVNELAFYRCGATAMLPEGSALVNTLRLSNIRVATYAADGTAVTPETDAADDTADEPVAE